jgi:hypothetical protein
MNPTTTTNIQQIRAAIADKLPNYVQAVHDLPDRRDHYRGSHWLSEEEWDEAKEHTIAYNDVFRDIIENNPTMRQDDIMSAVGDVAHELNLSEDEMEMIRHNTRGILHGMRHEVAFEQVLAALPEGFQIITTDDEDDAHGADFKVRCPNGEIVSIDVKATERLEEEAEKRTAYYMKKHHKKPPANEIVLFSGFDDEYDFTDDNPWRPASSAIERVLPYVQAELIQASQNYAVSMKKLGRVTY